MRFHFDARKSRRLRENSRRGIGWVGKRLYSLVLEIREDDEGEYYHMVTLWKSTREEEELYAENT